MQVMKTCLIGAVIGLSASISQAATVSIEGISGQFTDWGNNDAYGVSTSTSGNDASITWGKPPQGGLKSGYDFDAGGDLTATEGTDFALGTFSHHNWPIYTYPAPGKQSAIDWTELQVTFDVKIDDEMFQVTKNYTFLHDETPNKGDNGACAHGGQSGDAGVNVNGCADRVEAQNNEGSSSSVEVDGLLYTFEFSGFEIGGETVDFFLTKEQAITEAVLKGKYTVEALVSPVPLPAAGWMLIAGVGGLAAMKRKKRRSNA